MKEAFQLRKPSESSQYRSKSAVTKSRQITASKKRILQVADSRAHTAMSKGRKSATFSRPGTSMGGKSSSNFLVEKIFEATAGSELKKDYLLKNH